MTVSSNISVCLHLVSFWTNWCSRCRASVSGSNIIKAYTKQTRLVYLCLYQMCGSLCLSVRLFIFLSYHISVCLSSNIICYCKSVNYLGKRFSQLTLWSMWHWNILLCFCGSWKVHNAQKYFFWAFMRQCSRIKLAQHVNNSRKYILDRLSSLIFPSIICHFFHLFVEMFKTTLGKVLRELPKRVHYYQICACNLQTTQEN
jgi:hypothetical protein